jgi:uncharacterized protein
LFEGTMRGLFSILFGAGCMLLLTRLEKRDMKHTPADIYYRRLLWLLLFGLFNAFILLWPGDILYSYAICGLFLYPFRNLKAKHLLILSIVFLVISGMQGSYRLFGANYVRTEGEKAIALEQKKVKLTDRQVEMKQAWMGMQEHTKPENLRKDADKLINALGNQGYGGVFMTLLPINTKLQSSKFYGSSFFDVLALFFLGMALFKYGVVTGKQPKKTYWLMMLICYPIALALSYWNLHSWLAVNFDFTRIVEKLGFEYYEFRRTLMTLGHMSLIILLYQYGVFKFLWRWMARVGQMAFTNYLVQSIICTLFFYGYGLGYFGKLQRYETYYVVFAVWAFQIVFSNVWLHYFRFGPFEWAWRSLTYWNRQPMKKAKAKEPEETIQENEPMLA